MILYIKNTKGGDSYRIQKIYIASENSNFRLTGSV